MAGAAFLNYWPVRELPDGFSWRLPSYECMAPATFVLRDAMVHGSAGIISLGDDVLAETLVHTEPGLQDYTVQSGQIAIRRGRETALHGTHVSILAGATRNYFHSVMESAARVCMVPAPLLQQAGRLLYPREAANQPEMLNRLGLPASLQMQAVEQGETFRVERLLFPWSVHGQASYHPMVSDFYDRMSASIPDSADRWPRRFYIDRRGSAARVLENETALAAAVQASGIIPVRLENLPFADQVRLFRNAELVVAPHGAGLTNLGFARPGCRVLELHMDAYVNWCFRNLAALRGLDYDCIIGRATGPWLDVPSAAVHAMRWNVSLPHVLAGLETAAPSQRTV